jgi:hypothetical protein
MKVKFEPRDLWIGAYIGRREFHATGTVHFWNRTIFVCLIPTIVISFEYVAYPPELP